MSYPNEQNKKLLFAAVVQGQSREVIERVLEFLSGNRVEALQPPNPPEFDPISGLQIFPDLSLSGRVAKVVRCYLECLNLLEEMQKSCKKDGYKMPSAQIVLKNKEC